MIFGGSSRSLKRFYTAESDFNKVHKFKYDYSNTIYNGFKENINVLCKEHGEFSITPKRHIEGQGCPICTDITLFGHPAVSKANLKSHREILLKYLEQTYQDFDFSEFNIDDNGFHFVCKKHGKITNTKLFCEQCRNDKIINKKIQTTVNLLKNRTEEIVSLEYNKVRLRCDHGVYEYNNSQLYGDVQLCRECANIGFNRITTDEFIKRSLERVGDVFGIKDTTYVDAKTKIPLMCDIHGRFEILPSNFFKGQGCNKCTHRTSKPEEELLKLIPNGIQGDRSIIKPFELDILSDSFAVEYNGLMWHSEGNSASVKFNKRQLSKIHLNKTELCEAKGIQLFHIFENEWLHSKEKWISVINNAVGKSTKLWARQCHISEIPNDLYKVFCEENHLQGYGIAKIKVGLFYNEELISVMSFGKSRFNNNFEYELIRFCSKLGTIVVGGAGKLLKYFERTYKPKSIISYANRRWSQGNLYEKLGFTFINNTPPNYWYFKPNENKLYSRTIFQKHKLSKILSNFDIKLSESENMFNHGYRKIYDSGNKVYIKQYKY